MHTGIMIHPTSKVTVNGYISDVNGDRVMFLRIAERFEDLTIIVRDPAFLDKPSNEAERLCREFVGDVPVCKGEPAEVAR